MSQATDAVVETGTFKGKSILMLKKSKDDTFPFSFGIGKAQLIIQHIDAIEKFVAEHAQKPAEPVTKPEQKKAPAPAIKTVTKAGSKERSFVI